MSCRIHGPTCSTVWGYDQAHTDSARPYTMLELEQREKAPHRFAYPTVEEYVEAFHIWRAMSRDARLNDAEREAYNDGLREELERRYQPQ